MYIFVVKNIEICPLRDSHLRVTLTNVCMWAFEHAPCSAVSHHISTNVCMFISRTVSHLSQIIFNLVRKTATFRFWAPFEGLGATYAVHVRLIRNSV